MAQWVEAAADGCVVELGGGTGAVTAALLRSGVPCDRLIVIERSSHFVRHLRRRFPDVRIVHGDAADVDIAADGALPVKAIVSGLPLRCLPADEVKKIVRACARIGCQRSPDSVHLRTPSGIAMARGRHGPDRQ